jgi:hypothetical protein
MPDKYDKAIAYLSEHPEEIQMAWADGHDLFQYLTPTGRIDDHCKYGCPTMVKKGLRVAYRSKLTAMVRAADIPDRSSEITPAHLPAFAEIQRLADKVLERK